MLNKSLNDEFMQDNRVRPYTVGMTIHDETLSTILLYQEGDSNFKENDLAQYDFLSNLETEVNDITVEGVSSDLAYGSVINDPGDIAIVKLDGYNNYYGVFNNFSLIEITESTDQIKSVHVNFGSDWNAFFFGEQPRIYTFSGYFIDTQDYPFYQEFFVAYEKYLSGRRTIENKMKTKFVYDGKIVDGYILGISVKTTAQNQNLKQFQFSVLVRGVTWARTNIIDTNYKVQIDKFGQATQLIKQERVFNGMTNKTRHKNLDLTGYVQQDNRFWNE